MAGLHHCGHTLASSAAKDHFQECGPRNAFTASHFHFACRWRKFKYVLDWGWHRLCSTCQEYRRRWASFAFPGPTVALRVTAACHWTRFGSGWRQSWTPCSDVVAFLCDSGTGCKRYDLLTYLQIHLCGGLCIHFACDLSQHWMSAK